MKRGGSACLAGSGLMSIVLDPETADITSSTGGRAKGMYPRMSPELFYPGAQSGLSKFQLTTKMAELWNVAQGCWNSHPRDRPSLPTVFGNLDTFASPEAVTPFVLREPRPMCITGE